MVKWIEHIFRLRLELRLELNLRLGSRLSLKMLLTLELWLGLDSIWIVCTGIVKIRTVTLIWMKVGDEVEIVFVFGSFFASRWSSWVRRGSHFS